MQNGTMRDMETGNGTYAREALEAEAARLAKSLAPGERARVVALIGDLGAGKTTFVQALARSLGVHEPVTSPTYVIEKIYPLEGQAFARLVHIDAYRLDTPDELVKLDWARTLSDAANLIVIEWADRVKELLPHDAITARLAVHDADTRTLAYDN